MLYLLDACALLAVFNGEPGEQMVLGLIEQARIGESQLSMNIVQLLEVYYDRLYVAREHDARAIVESILYEPINIIESIPYPVMYEAGRFKTSYLMSLADAIAATTAINLAATLVTKDKEMKPAEEAGELHVLWLN
jgi:predicted nucleic acid-binding protein